MAEDLISLPRAAELMQLPVEALDPNLSKFKLQRGSSENNGAAKSLIYKENYPSVGLFSPSVDNNPPPCDHRSLGGLERVYAGDPQNVGIDHSTIWAYIMRTCRS